MFKSEALGEYFMHQNYNITRIKYIKINRFLNWNALVIMGIEKKKTML